MTRNGDSAADEYDVVVVGGGAAGLSAALVLSRGRRRVAVVDAGEPRNAPAAHLHGFLGSDGMSPSELLRAGREEVAGYGGHLLQGQVGDVVHATETSSTEDGRLGYRVLLEDGRHLRARRVLVTTGLRDEIPAIPGVGERWGRDLLHCPYCHGWEVRDQPLGVLGGTPEAVVHAQLVSEWSSDVMLFTHGVDLTAEQREQLTARGIGIMEPLVARLLVEDDHLTGVELESGQVVPRAAVFARPRFVPTDDLLVGLGCATHDNGWVAVDATGCTSVPGIWAAGNAVNPRAQVITAAGEGSAAAIAINQDLVDEDVSQAVADLHRGSRGVGVC